MTDKYMNNKDNYSYYIYGPTESNIHETLKG